jgi:hypothetical protein
MPGVPTLIGRSNASVRVVSDVVLRASELPAVDAMATIVRPGTNAESNTPVS